MERFLNRIEPLLKIGFSLHDVASNFLARSLKQVKIAILIVAHASLLGFFFPSSLKTFGNVAELLLLGILLVSPLAKVLHMKLLYQIMSLRRELGIWFAYVAIVHGVGFMINPEWFERFMPPQALQSSVISFRYLFGMIALVLTVPLLITSNTFSLKLLKKNWKRVHWLVYPVFALMLLHTLTPRRADESIAVAIIQFILIFGAYVILKFLAVAPEKRIPAPLRATFDQVATRYRAFIANK